MAGAAELAVVSTAPAKPRLGGWVELHTEVTGSGELYRIAVNRRDGTAMRLTAEDLARVELLDGLEPAPGDALVEELYDGGFLTERPVAADVRSGGWLRCRWLGADRAVRALYCRGAHLLFTRWAVLAQILVAVAGTVAMIAAQRSRYTFHLSIRPGQLPELLALNLVAITIHELGHALVVTHHGRRVHAAGMRLHLGAPAFYVDAVELLLLPRRVRIVQAAAGPWAEWQVTSIAAVVFLIAPSPVLHRFIVLNAFVVLSNLIPFAGLDGSHLLADLLRQPDLRSKSRIALARLATERRLPRGERALAGYAALDLAVAGALLVSSGFLWYAAFGRSFAALVHSGPPGAVAAIVLGVVVFGPTMLIVGGPGANLCDAARFRLERRWRVNATRHLAAHPLLDGLDDHGLSVAAGHLERRHVPAGYVFDAPSFTGIALVREHGGHRVAVPLPGAGLRLEAQSAIDLILLDATGLVAAGAATIGAG